MTQKIQKSNLNLKKTKTEPTVNFNHCSYSLPYVRVYHRVQLSYTTQHKAVLTIFPVMLRTIIIAPMLSTVWEGMKSSVFSPIL